MNLFRLSFLLFAIFCFQIPGAFSQISLEEAKKRCQKACTPDHECALFFGECRMCPTAAGNKKCTHKKLSGIESIPNTTYKNGEKFDDCNGAGWCPKMVVVRGGTFRMGSDDAKEENVRPARDVSIKKFAVGHSEVTNKEFVTFLNDVKRRGTKSKPWFSASDIRGTVGDFKVLSGKEDHPVNWVSWYGAKAYVNWLSRKTGQSYRLLSEAEWEYASAGGYFFRVKLEDFANSLALMAKAPPRVGQWVEDCWHKNYQNAPTDGSAWLEANDGDCSHRVVRGFFFFGRRMGLYAPTRMSVEINEEGILIGFRIARTLP